MDRPLQLFILLREIDNMANVVYFAGSDPAAFNGNFIVDTTVGRFDSNYVRCGLLSGTHIIEANLKVETPANSPDGFWLHFNKWQDTDRNTGDANNVTIYDETGNLTFILLNPALGGKLRLYANNDSYVDGPNITSLYNTSPDNNIMMHIDIHVYTNTNGHAQADIYRSGHFCSTVTNTNGYARGGRTFKLQGNSGWGPIYVYSEVIIANFDTRNLRVKTCIPTSNGLYTDAIGGFDNIDEVSRTEDKVSIVNLDDRFSFKTTPHGQASNKPIIAVGVNCHGYSPDDTAGIFAGLRINGVDYYANTTIPLLGTISGGTYVFTGHPNGGGNFPTNIADDVEVILKAAVI